MVRGFVFGAIAFAAAFAAEKNLTRGVEDIRRYNRLQAMSGAPPFGRELVDIAQKKASDYMQTGEGRQFVNGLTEDVLRYMRMRAM